MSNGDLILKIVHGVAATLFVGSIVMIRFLTADHPDDPYDGFGVALVIGPFLIFGVAFLIFLLPKSSKWTKEVWKNLKLEKYKNPGLALYLVYLLACQAAVLFLGIIIPGYLFLKLISDSFLL